MGLSTLATVGLVAGGLGTVASVAGSIAQGQQQADAARQAAQVAANNAAISEQNARDTLKAGQAEEQRKRLETAQKIGAMRAQAGASGVDVGLGSTLDSFADTAMIGDYDATVIRNNYGRQANSYYQEAANYKNQANADNAAASNATTNSIFGATGSLLSGASSVASSWYKYNSDTNSTKKTTKG